MGLGLHGGGVGAAKFFVKASAKVIATDLRTKHDLQESINQLKGFPVKYVLGKHRDENFKKADLIIRNPAVPDDSKYLQIAQEHNVPVDTDIGIFFELCPASIIGITGTRGKSTTSTLIYEFLKTKYPDIILAGNIRKSVLLELSCITKNTLVVLELSSWQVEGLAKHRWIRQAHHKKSPHIAVVTNIMPDHLNRYKGMKEYIAAKKLIFKYQTKNDFLFLNKDDKIVKNFSKEAKAKVIFYNKNDAKKYGFDRLTTSGFDRLTTSGFDRLTTSGFDRLTTSNLPGEHNLSNIAAAIKVAKLFKIPKQTITTVLKNFRGLDGRIQLIREVNGVKYINDTCATTPDATIAAINALVSSKQLTVNNKLILIAGGADKNLDFEELAQLIVKKISTVILLDGTATDRFEKTIRKELKIRNQKLKIKRVSDMRKAVKLAQQESKAGDIVLLSPACASFGLFRHEFERGNKFVQAISYLKK